MLGPADATPTAALDESDVGAEAKADTTPGDSRVSVADLARMGIVQLGKNVGIDGFALVPDGAGSDGSRSDGSSRDESGGSDGDACSTSSGSSSAGSDNVASYNVSFVRVELARVHATHTDAGLVLRCATMMPGRLDYERDLGWRDCNDEPQPYEPRLGRTVAAYMVHGEVGVDHVLRLLRSTYPGVRFSARKFVLLTPRQLGAAAHAVANCTLGHAGGGGVTNLHDKTWSIPDVTVVDDVGGKFGECMWSPEELAAGLSHLGVQVEDAGARGRWPRGRDHT